MSASISSVKYHYKAGVQRKKKKQTGKTLKECNSSTVRPSAQFHFAIKNDVNLSVCDWQADASLKKPLDEPGEEQRLLLQLLFRSLPFAAAISS